jgi:hypothetical protein
MVFPACVQSLLLHQSKMEFTASVLLFAAIELFPTVMDPGIHTAFEMRHEDSLCLA